MFFKLLFKVKVMGDFNMNFIWILLLISCTGSMAVVNKHRIPWLKIRFNNKEPFENFASRYTNILSDRSQLQRPENGDPCDSIIPPRPRWNFGQRISDKRCTEYMSDMMYRNTLKERQEKCLQKHGKKPGQTYIRLLHKHSTKEGEYPHMAAIGWRRRLRNSWAFLCGGSLISPNFVLTAAHCGSQSTAVVTSKYLRKAQPDIVRLGSTYIKTRRNPESDVTIKQFIQHPYWDPPKHYYDIALVELAKPVTFSKTVQPACLPGSFASKYDAYITGWGVTDGLQKHGKKPGQTYIRLLHKHSTKEGEYPHMAAIGWRRRLRNSWAFLCGGSLISPNFVLTAAHCGSQSTAVVTSKYLRKAQPDIVRLGSTYIKTRRNPESDVTIKQFIQHPYWDPPKHYYDIALVELAKPVTFSKTVQPACLPGSFASKYDAYITGWGVTDETAKKLSPVLQAAEVDIIDSSECNTLLTPFSNRNWWGVMDHQLCAGKLEGGVDTCQGDSGGPLQVKLQETKHEGIMHMVIGVTSFGFKCGLKDKPGIYTRVSSFIDWIESIVWPQ